MPHGERHRSGRIGWLRAAVLGANDGTIHKLPRNPHNIISLSADQRWLAYAQVDQAGSDIVLAEHFR